MADVVSLLQQHYDPTYGIVDVRKVIDELQKTSGAFDEMSRTFHAAEPQWRLPILEGMRTLAATVDCSEDQAAELLRITDTVAADVGVDEYFKSINAVVMSPKAAGALPAYAVRLLERRNDGLARRLAFYAAAMLLLHDRSRITEPLRRGLESAAEAETSAEQKEEFREILAQLRA